MNNSGFMIDNQWIIKRKQNIFLIDVKKNSKNILSFFLPLNIMLYIDRFVNKLDREKRIISYSFLYAYAKHRGVKELEIMHEKFRKPHFIKSELKFSISYSREYILIGISDYSEIGVDIEFFDRRKLSAELCASVMHPDELVVLYNCKNELEKADFFYELWTKKESLTKAMGCGLSYDFRKINLTKNNMLGNKHNEYEVDFFIKLADYRIAVSSIINKY